MQTKTQSAFKAVEYMRQVRNDLALMFQKDKNRFHDELKQAMADFIASREKASRQHRF